MTTLHLDWVELHEVGYEPALKTRINPNIVGYEPVLRTRIYPNRVGYEPVLRTRVPKEPSEQTETGSSDLRMGALANSMRRPVREVRFGNTVIGGV